MQNKIVKWIMDGITWLMDKLDALFNALMEKIGLNALIDRIIQSIPGMQELVNALNQLNAKIIEMLDKLNEIRAEIRRIRQKLDDILSVIENIIQLLKGLLAYKALIELQIPEFVSLTKDLKPEVSVNDFLKMQDELLNKMEQNDEFSQELAMLNNDLDEIDFVLNTIDEDSTEEQISRAVLQLKDLVPDENYSYQLQDGETDMSKLINEAIRDEVATLNNFLKHNPDISEEDKEELAEAVSYITEE
jgi:hypothetical protein